MDGLNFVHLVKIRNHCQGEAEEGGREEREVKCVCVCVCLCVCLCVCVCVCVFRPCSSLQIRQCRTSSCALFFIFLNHLSIFFFKKKYTLLCIFTYFILGLVFYFLKSP